jgi:hypothetical protein
MFVHLKIFKNLYVELKSFNPRLNPSYIPLLLWRMVWGEAFRPASPPLIPLSQERGGG